MRNVSAFEPEIVVKKGIGIHASPDEDAAIVAFSAEGATVSQIAKKLDRSATFVNRHKAMYQRQIDEKHALLMEDRVDDYTDVIVMTLIRLKERLVDDERADEISEKDLAFILRTAFDKRLDMRERPTSLNTANEEEADGRTKYLDGVAMGIDLARTFDEGFESQQRRLIAAACDEDGDIVVGEVQ